MQLLGGLHRLTLPPPQRPRRPGGSVLRAAAWARCRRRAWRPHRRLIASAAAGAAVQIEHRAAVVGEVELALAVGDVDAVRQKEIGADQHVDVAAIVYRLRTDAQLRVAHLLVADLEAGERCDPGLHDSPPHADAIPAGITPSLSGVMPARFAASSVSGETPAPVSNKTWILAPLRKAIPGGMRGSRRRIIDVDDGKGCDFAQYASGESRQSLVCTSRMTPVREVVLDVAEQPEHVLTQQTRRARAEIVAGDQELDVGNGNVEERERLTWVNHACASPPTPLTREPEGGGAQVQFELRCGRRG